MKAPKKLRDKASRAMARCTRDRQWEFTGRCNNHSPLWFCVWNKARRPEEADEWRDCLITGLEIQEWIERHSDWFKVGDWDEARYARPVWITPAGQQALIERAKYDMEPVFGGLVEPGWQCIPLPSDKEPAHA